MKITVGLQAFHNDHKDLWSAQLDIYLTNKSDKLGVDI